LEPRQVDLLAQVVNSRTNPLIFSSPILCEYGAIPYNILRDGGFEDVVRKVETWLGGRLKDIRGFIDGVCGHELHAKRVDSLAGATLGVMTSASLAVAVIGQALAQARGLVTKHAIKQVDRLLSNHGIDVWDSFACWVPYLIGARNEIVVAMDWTDYDRDGQATLALNLVTRHGRARLAKVPTAKPLE
jgi:hypothetical protein